MSRTGGDQKVYVGNLPGDVREKEIGDVFEKYGRIKLIDIKSGRGPSFAFLEFEDQRDAEDAVRGRDGYEFDGRRLRVEFTHGVGPRGAGGRVLGNDREDFRGGRGRGGFGGGRGRGGPQRRTGHRVIVEGLPQSGSWQDLKDHMREAGDVCYADVSRDGTGVVEYTSADDVKYAIRKLDDTKFKSHEGDTAYIRVREDSSSGGRRGGSRDRSPDRDRSRSRSRSPRDNSRDSPRGSPRRSRFNRRSPSASRSPSRSPSPR